MKYWNGDVGVKAYMEVEVVTVILSPKRFISFIVQPGLYLPLRRAGLANLGEVYN